MDPHLRSLSRCCIELGSHFQIVEEVRAVQKITPETKKKGKGGKNDKDVCFLYHFVAPLPFALQRRKVAGNGPICYTSYRTNCSIWVVIFDFDSICSIGTLCALVYMTYMQK